MAASRDDVLMVIKGEKGFTLIETILSLSIIVILLGLVLSSLRLGQSSWEKGEGAVLEAASRRFVVKRFSEDVGSMYLYAERRDDRVEYIFSAGAEEFAFVTVNRSGMAGQIWGGVKSVKYSAGIDGLTVRERTLPEPSGVQQAGERIVEVGPEVEKVRFEYFGADGWVRNWNLRKEEKLPRAVRGEFSFRGIKDPLVVTVKVGVTNTRSLKAGKKTLSVLGGA